MDISVDERNTYQRNPNRHTGNNNSDSLLSTNIPSEPSRRPDGQSMRNSQGKSNGSGGFLEQNHEVMRIGQVGVEIFNRQLVEKIVVKTTGDYQLVII